jgi:hypothetical protein
MEGSLSVIVGIVLVECALLDDKVNILEHIFITCSNFLPKTSGGIDPFSPRDNVRRGLTMYINISMAVSLW